MISGYIDIRHRQMIHNTVALFIRIKLPILLPKKALVCHHMKICKRNLNEKTTTDKTEIERHALKMHIVKLASFCKVRANGNEQVNYAYMRFTCGCVILKFNTVINRDVLISNKIK